MCDLTQFFVSTITTETHAENLARILMENVIFLFGMVAIIFVDTNSWFNKFFKYMCTALGIIYWHLALRNEKGTSVEKYHRFLNKTQAISGQDRGTHDVFIQNAKTSQYAWNSASIDGIYIIIIVAAVGQELCFS